MDNITVGRIYTNYNFNVAGGKQISVGVETRFDESDSVAYIDFTLSIMGSITNHRIPVLCLFEKLIQME